MTVKNGITKMVQERYAEYCIKVAGIVMAVFLAVSLSAFASTTAKILILYDQGSDQREPALTDAKYLANLMGHFNTSVRLAPVAQYQSGTMDRNDAVFYINYEKKFALPEAFKNDFYHYNKTFGWINHQIAQIDQQFVKKTFGFHYQGYSENHGYDTIDYKNVIFPKGDDNIEIVIIDNPAIAHVVSYAYNHAGAKVPYIVHASNFWYVADSPFSYTTERDRYIAFADLLHDILHQNHPERHTALIRIEDINPTSDAKAVRRLTSYLSGKKIPFSVGVVPIYINPTERTELHLADNPKLLSLLRDVPSLGGTIVLHGYTHQYHGNSTDDYEFWDDIADKPIRGNSVENASLRIEKSIKECLDNNVYPLTWETPHYFASRETYIAIKKHFSCVYERSGTMDHLGTDQFFPYEVRNLDGQFVIPENCGYVPIDKPDAQPIIEAARLNLTVRDGYASFFFHPFINVSYLKKIINSLKGMGYEFGDIKDFSPQVTAPDEAVICGNAKVHIDTRERYIFEEEYNSAGKDIKKNILQGTGKPITLEVAPAKGDFVVIKPAEALEPGLVERIWLYAKKDLNYFRFLRPQNPAGKLNDVKEMAFIVPAVYPKDAAEAHDLQSMRFSLSVAGVKCKEISTTDILNMDLREYDIIVVPLASAKNLSEDAIARIKEAVSSGAGLVFDGASKINDAFDIKNAEDPIKVKQIRDFQFPEIPLFWPGSVDVWPVYKSSEDQYRVLDVEEQTNAPLVVSGKYGNGTFLYFSTYFDPLTDRGYSRFPFLIETLQTVFDFQLLAARKTSEMYFDPGTRQFISIEKLVKLWRKYGINKIYAGGWHFYDKYSYDYARLIKVCHENGVLVYCWLEPPMVNQRFWNKYPRWREKTALLKEGGGSWRLLMNLADPDCLKKALDETSDLLLKYDWDGANLAELYFESLSGPERADLFTPMNNVVRTTFKEKAGFDPIELFRAESPYYWKTNNAAWTQFAIFRRDLCSHLKEQYLEMLSKVRKKKDTFEIIVTFIDTSLAPNLEYFLAEDMQRTIQLQKKYDVTLQVEDSSPFWSGKPERYAYLGAFYRKLVKDPSRLQLDCNVLDSHKQGEGGLPAEKPTGEEMRQITYNMVLPGCRPVFYSEETIHESDFRNISTVLARDTTISSTSDNQWKVTTPSMVTVYAGKKNLITYLDNEPWFAMEGESIIVPGGEHTLTFAPEPRYFDMNSLHPRLSYISADLKWANFISNAIEFAYDAGPAPCLIVVNKRPSKIFVDDKKISFTVNEADHGFSIKLPGGTHSVHLSMGGGVAFIIESSGVVIFSLIIIFGFFASILFIGLFVLIQIKRKYVKGTLPL
ncbi:MAG: polysaccharide deacetylase family protein [Endomicrobiales bacterium]